MRDVTCVNIKTMVEPYVKKKLKPWGYELHWVEESMPYMGKVIHIDCGKRLSLQTHDQKQESWFLIIGRAKIIDDYNRPDETPEQRKKERGE